MTVQDNTGPTAKCKDLTIFLNNLGLVTLTAAQVNNGSTDNCSVWSYSPSVKVYHTADIGVNNLTVTVKDYSNNTSTCVSVVTVQPYNFQIDNNERDDNGLPSLPSEAFLTATSNLSLFPNPTTGDAVLAFKLPVKQAFVVRILDLTGKVAFSRKGEGLEGENSLSIRLGGVAPWLYFLDFQTEDVKAQMRLMVQE